MAPTRRSSERSSYRSQRDYQQLPQQSYPSRRQHSQSRRTPPRRDSGRDYSSRRDYPPRRNPSFSLPRRSGPPPRRNDASARRLLDVNPFQRFGSRRRLPEREYSSSRNSRSDRQKWLPPVRNPARYIDPPLDTNPSTEEKSRYPERELTPVPISRRRSSSLNRSRSPLRRSSLEKNENGGDRPRREGPRTPPEPNPSDHSPDNENDLQDEDNEIFDIVRSILSQCYSLDKSSQSVRFDWLRTKLISIQHEIEALRNQPPIDDLELVDSTNHSNHNIEHDLNGEELDYQEEPDSSSRNNDDYNGIRSPPNEDFAVDNNEELRQ